jgi:hypothetical protein
MTTLTQDEAHRLFVYRDGQLFWKIRPANCVRINDAVGGTNGKKSPYLRLRINKQRHLVHKVVFLMHHGYTPDIVDHIDGNIANNKIENLRAANKTANRLNAGKNKNNTSGCKNVYWHKRSKQWNVRLRVNGDVIHCGTFKDFDIAESVAQKARNLYHGEFANHR